MKTISTRIVVTFGLVFGQIALGQPNSLLAEDQAILKGQLSGRSGHKVSGTVNIVKSDAGYNVQFQSNFKLDGSPGPYLGFGNGEKYVRSTEFSKLRKNRGVQTYKIPAKVDISNFDTFIIWCKPYKVPLAVAKLQ